MPNKEFLLVEPVAKTPYPPLGLMKISSMLKQTNKHCFVFTQVGNEIPERLHCPDTILFVLRAYRLKGLCIRRNSETKMYKQNTADTKSDDYKAIGFVSDEVAGIYACGNGLYG